MSLADTARKLLSRSLSAFDQRKAKAAETYGQLVYQVATAPNKIAEKELIQKLDELAADPAKFAADVDRLLRRLQWREVLDTEPAVSKRLEDIHSKLAEAKETKHNAIAAAKAAALEAEKAAEAAFVKIEESLDRERRIEERKVDQINEAKRQLLDTAPDAVKQALEDAKGEELEVLVRTAGPSESITQQVAHRIGQLRVIIQQLKARYADITFVPTSRGSNFDVEKCKLEQKLAAAQNELARLQSDNRPEDRPDHRAARAAAAEKIAAAQAAFFNP